MLFNLQNTYVISYLKRGKPETTYEDWIFVAQVKPFMSGVMSGVGGEISRRIGLRKCLALGVTIYRHVIKCHSFVSMYCQHSSLWQWRVHADILLP